MSTGCDVQCESPVENTARQGLKTLLMACQAERQRPAPNTAAATTAALDRQTVATCCIEMLCQRNFNIEYWTLNE
jgi:hypothetical protein